MVDLGEVPDAPKAARLPDRRVSELVKLLEQYTPGQADSPYALYLPGFSMLRLLLTKQVKPPQESELISTVLESYSSYKSSGRSNQEIACLTARDFMVLYQSNGGADQQQQQQLQQPQQQMKSNGQQAFNVQSMQHFASQPSPAMQQQQQQHSNVLQQQQLSSLGPASSNFVRNQSGLGGSQHSFMQGMQHKQGGTPHQLHLNNFVHQRSNQPQALLPSPAGQSMQPNNALQLQSLSLPGSQQMNPIMMSTAFHPPHQHS